MNIKRALAILFVTYAVTTIFAPKIMLPSGRSGFYFFEVLCGLATAALFFSGRLKLSRIERAYAGYAFFALLAWFWGAAATGEPDLKNLLLIFKFLSFVFLLSVAAYLQPLLSEAWLARILSSQVLFVAAWGGYVLFNTLSHPISLGALSGNYSRDYRLIGLTGHAYSWENGLMEIGHTSVQMGVYTAMLALVFLKLYLDFRRPRHLAAGLVCLAGTMLTYSRSGLLALACGLAYGILTRSKLQRWLFPGLALAVPIGLWLFYYSDLGASLLSFGTLGKLSINGLGDSQRLYYWGIGLDYLASHPAALLLGTGSGEQNGLLHKGTLESLFLDTVVQSGLPALLFLCLTFFRLWSATAGEAATKTYSGSVLAGLHLGVPGLIVGCLVGGSVLHTDFVAPTFYLCLGICLARQRATAPIATPARA